MSPLDEQLINRKAKLIEADLGMLQKYTRQSEETYIHSEEAQLSVERLLERMIGRLIDINYHVLKEKYSKLPIDYFDSFLEVAKQKVVKEDLALEVAKSTGLRNILAHEYDEIDNRKVYQAIKTALTQVPQYLQSVLTSLSS